MNRIFVLGARGMLGQALVEEFQQAGYDVVPFDHERLDITDFHAVEAVLDELKPEMILNTVAHNGVDDIEISDDVYAKAHLLNKDAVEHLASLCRERNILLVHYSTDYVFHGDRVDGYKEVDETDPVSRYGMTKAAGEQAVQKHADRYYILRLSRLFGRPGTSQASKKSFVDAMISLVVEKGKTELNVVDEELSSPTYAPDLARRTRELVEGSFPYGIYHGANTGACTWYEFAIKIFALKGLSPKLTPVSGDAFPRPAKRPKFSILLNTKLPQARAWEEALEEYLK